MGDYHGIPETNLYKLDFSKLEMANMPGMREMLSRAVEGIDEDISDMERLLQNALNNPELRVEEGSKDGHIGNLITLSRTEGVARFLGVDKEELLQLNIPYGYTKQVHFFRKYIHEGTHAENKSGMLGFSSKNDFIHDENPYDERKWKKAAARLMGEVRSDLKVGEVFTHFGHPEFSDVSLQTRRISATMGQISKIKIVPYSYRHDTATIIDHYLKTNKVLNPFEYINAKMALTKKYQEILGVSQEVIDRLSAEYAPRLEEYGISVTDKDFLKKAFSNTIVSPDTPAIMAASYQLLHWGKLNAFESSEVFAHIKDAEKLGFKPDPYYNYEERCANAIENYIVVLEAKQQETLRLEGNLPPTESITKIEVPNLTKIKIITPKSQELISGKAHAPLELYYDPSIKPIPFDSRVEILQRQLLRLAALDEDFKINLGTYGDGHGVDGRFGPAVQRAVIAAQIHLDSEPGGYPSSVVNQDFMATLDNKIAALEAMGNLDNTWIKGRKIDNTPQP